MISNDSVGYGQPEASAAADILGGEEGLEHVRQMLRLNPRAIVPYLDAHEFFLAPTEVGRRLCTYERDASLDEPSALQRLNSVHEQIGEDLLKLVWIDESADRRFRFAGRQDDLLSGRQRREHFDRL